MDGRGCVCLLSVLWKKLNNFWWNERILMKLKLWFQEHPSVKFEEVCWLYIESVGRRGRVCLAGLVGSNRRRANPEIEQRFQNIKKKLDI
jgi:hypothetical protein